MRGFDSHPRLHHKLNVIGLSAKNGEELESALRRCDNTHREIFAASRATA